MKKLLIIGFVWPEPKSSAAGGRMLQLILIFKELDYEITFASTALNLEYSENLSLLDIKTAQIQLNDASFDVFCKNLNPTAVLFDRFLTEEQFGWRVAEVCPTALRILDTEDLHSLRLTRQKAIKEGTAFCTDDLLQSDVAKREIASIYRCDLSLMVSEFEMDLLKNVFLVPDFLVYYLPIFVEEIIDNDIDFDKRQDFVFIGNFLHEPNFDAVKYLYDNIWDGIHKQLPTAKMNVYGAYPMQKVLQLHNPKKNFYVHGRAENAQDVIEKARILLAPIRFGAGIKGKLIEAMQFGTPSITTSIGAESMHDNLSWNGFICDSEHELIEKSVLLYTDKTIWQKAKKNGYDILKNRYKKSLFDANFKNKIMNLEQNYLRLRTKNFTGTLLLHHTANSTKYMSKWIEEKNKKPL